MAALRQVILSGFSNSRFCMTKHRAFNVHSRFETSPQSSRFDYRQISQLVNPDDERLSSVDTLALARSLEAQGMPWKQAETITKVLNDSLENAAHSFVSKAEMKERHFSLLQRETEKLRVEIEKMRGELVAAKLEAKYDVIKCCGTIILMSLTAFGLVFICM